MKNKLSDVVRQHGLWGTNGLAEEDQACEDACSSDPKVVGRAAIKLSRRMVCWRELAEDLLAHMPDEMQRSFFEKQEQRRAALSGPAT